jgi:Ca2+:H+ antiporter
MVTVILCVFLLSYMYGEGKSNYFKGSILILSYLVVVVGFYFSSFDNVSEMVLHGVNPSDTLALGPRMGLMRGNVRVGRGGEL